jgi:two-component system cell cycle sensor histidine kinase/response regulator CckA
MVGAMVDVTDRRRLEEQLAHAEKMESVARLAGGVAHDFNNLLTVILSHAELMREPIRHLATATEDLNQIESATVRAAALTKQLLAFARRQVITPKVLELNDLLRGRERVLRRLVGDNIELELRLAPGRSLIRADPRQIEQVVINLAMNARDAMPRGGRLIIETELKNSEDVVLVVSDTGEGMSTEVMEHAFDPFFTTKPVGQGSGLGLATCYGIVKQSDGHIEVSSELGRGTTFRLYFPKGYEIDTQPVHAGSEVTPRGSETILLVEDEDSLRLVAGRTLRRQGYSILEAASGAEALRMAKETDRPIHLLLTDVVMPQMSGRDLADRLRALRPGIRILFTSGYTEDAISRHGILDPEVNFLPKPYVPALLTRRVRETLDGAAG